MVVEFHLSNASVLPSTRRWHSLEEHKGMIDRKYDGRKGGVWLSIAIVTS